MNGFSDTPRIYKFPASLLADVPGLRDDYGHDAPDGPRTVRCLCAGWDDTAHTRLRAMELPSTATAVALTDGTFAFGPAFWSEAIEAALTLGEDDRLADVTEITPEQLESLRPEPEI